MRVQRPAYLMRLFETLLLVHQQRDVSQSKEHPSFIIAFATGPRTYEFVSWRRELEGQEQDHKAQTTSEDSPGFGETLLCMLEIFREWFLPSCA